MSITSLPFVLAAAALIFLYYLIPKRFQWLLLLLASLGFYCAAGWISLPFLAFTSLSAWGAALLLRRMAAREKETLAARGDMEKEEKAALRRQGTRKRRAVLSLALLLNFGLLALFKYAQFLPLRFSEPLSLLLPLGISFYTFQTMGYLIDVYWGRAEPEKNPLKLLLFTSFFPQITQGPISVYGDLARQFYEPHAFSYEGFVSGARRMLWGYFKKLALANVLAPWVGAVFRHYSEYRGPAVLIGVFFYSIQIYADFSGYMDIMCGLCRILGIRLTENFERPYFSKSIAEYWRRWHISLGAWFKSYLYYPIAVSKWNTKIGRWSRKALGKTFGSALPASIALVAVWLVTGVWHGATWAYVAWGGVNGLFIIFSLWMEPVYKWLREKLHIRESSFPWRAFQVVRTYLLVSFIKVLPEVGTLSQGLGLWRAVFTGWSGPLGFAALFPYGPDRLALLAAAFGTALFLFSSLLQRKIPVQKWFGYMPLPLRALCLGFLLLIMVWFGVPAAGQGGGFLYAQF